MSSEAVELATRRGAASGGSVTLPREDLATALVGVAEIAERAGVAPDTIRAWRRRHADFPEPLAELASAEIWLWPEVLAWLMLTGRLSACERCGREVQLGAGETIEGTCLGCIAEAG